MFARSLLALLLVIFLTACGGGTDDPDAGPPGTVDAGPGSDDAGPGNDDAGPGSDDAGPAPADAGAPDAGPPACPGGGLTPGDTTIQLMHDGRMRTYRVHVPPSYDGSAAVPLVFNFHGFTSNAGQQIALSGMNDEADTQGFVAVHAEGTGLSRSWNGGLCCGNGMRDDVDDVGFVRAMLEDIAAQVCVDRSRVYATGMSNGGFLSHRLACEASDIIAAIAPVAGVMGVPFDGCAPPRPVPVMHFHGTADAIVPYGGGGFTSFPSVAATVDHWAARNGCTDMRESTYDMGDSHCETHDACDMGVEVTVCTVEGGGHLWPGGLGSGSTIDATHEMWLFLSRFSL